MPLWCTMSKILLYAMTFTQFSVKVRYWTDTCPDIYNIMNNIHTPRRCVIDDARESGWIFERSRESNNERRELMCSTYGKDKTSISRNAYCAFTRQDWYIPYEYSAARMSYKCACIKNFSCYYFKTHPISFFLFHVNRMERSAGRAFKRRTFNQESTQHLSNKL